MAQGKKRCMGWVALLSRGQGDREGHSDALVHESIQKWITFLSIVCLEGGKGKEGWRCEGCRSRNVQSKEKRALPFLLTVP